MKYIQFQTQPQFQLPRLIGTPQCRGRNKDHMRWMRSETQLREEHHTWMDERDRGERPHMRCMRQIERDEER